MYNCFFGWDAIPSGSSNNILYGRWEVSKDTCVSCLSLVDMHDDDCSGSSTCCIEVSWHWRDIDYVVVFVERDDTFHVTTLDLEVGFPGDVCNVLVLLGIIA